MLKVGVLGAGHLGKIHLKLLQQSNCYDLVGFYDADKNMSKKVASDFGYTAFETPEALIAAVDVVDIVTPTLYHFQMAQQALLAKKHIFLEKPITTTVEEAETLIALANKNQCMGQVGHVERFNPAFKVVRDQLNNPQFIEAHRLAEFNPRGTDVSVVLDLMIHDIDCILSVVSSPIQSISASGVSVISATPDIANARIAFENGCVANLTASRISLKNMRKTRFFQKDAYISVDFLDKRAESVHMRDAPAKSGEFDMILENAEGVKKQLMFNHPKVEPNNAILDELESFASSINQNLPPIVSLNQGKAALEVALKILSLL